MGCEYTEIVMINIHTLTEEEFNSLPLVVEGESKVVRYAGNGHVVIKLKPTIYSYTYNRTGIIPGSDTLRLKAMQRILPYLKQHGVYHAYQDISDHWILATLVLQPVRKGKKKPFEPLDMTKEEIEKLPKATPIEVVVKARHTGTSKHRYFEMDTYRTRLHESINEDQKYPEIVVRYDWRNPMYHPTDNTRLADEVLSEQMADWYINVEKSRQLARRTFVLLTKLFSAHQLELWDICFFISEDGSMVFGEISPDCMRVRTSDNVAVDKDVWRAGGSSKHVLKKWQSMVQMLEKET